MRQTELPAELKGQDGVETEGDADGTTLYIPWEYKA